MDEHIYDVIQEIELDSTGYIRPLNRSNRTQHKQHKHSIVKKTAGKLCVLLWIGIIIGSVVSGITVFSVVKYGGILLYNGSSCLWTEWTECTGCNLLLISGTEKRVQIYTGHALNCQQKEKVETRACEGNISTCFWTEWTVWTGCNSQLISGTEIRVQIYTGYDHNCQQIEKVETKACNENASSCFWEDWTSWTPCNLSLINENQTHIQKGKQTRSQMFTGYSKSCEQKKRFETKSCYVPDRTLYVRFDPTTLHSDCYLSEDQTILSNRYTDRTPYNPRARSRFQNYRGAMLNTLVKNSTSIYYEMNVQYVILLTLAKNWLVLELGIGKCNQIDNDYYVGNRNVSGWSFHFANCWTYNKVCLYAEHKPSGINEVIKPFSNSTAGTNANGTFGILIDRERNQITLFYNDTVLYSFYDVLSNVPLCPVFGVYLTGFAEVDLQIVSVGNMTFTV